MELYIIYAESINYAGYGQHFVVKGYGIRDAEAAAEQAIDEYFYEQDSDQLEEDGIEEGPYGTIISCEQFDETHESWEYYQDPSQDEFYTKVNF